MGANYTAKISLGGSGKVALAWDCKCYKRYVIRRRKAGDSAVELSQQVDASGTYEDTNVPLNTDYTYTVANIDDYTGVEGPESSPVLARVEIDQSDLLLYVSAPKDPLKDPIPGGLAWEGFSTLKGIFHQPGNVALEFNALHKSGASTTKTYSVRANPAPALTITTSSLPAASSGAFYSTILQAQGGVAPYRWSFVGENVLQEGLDLTRDGVIVGVPVSGSLYRPTAIIRVEDAAGNVAEKVFNDPVDINFGDPGQPDNIQDWGWVGVASRIEEPDVPIALLSAPKKRTVSAASKRLLASLAGEAAWDLAEATFEPKLVKPVDMSFLMPEQHLLSALEHLQRGGGGVIAKTDTGPATWFKLDGNATIGSRKPNQKEWRLDCSVEVKPNRRLYILSDNPAKKAAFMQANPTAIDLDGILAQHPEFLSQAENEVASNWQKYHSAKSEQNRIKYFEENVPSKKRYNAWRWLTARVASEPGQQIKVTMIDSEYSAARKGTVITNYKNGSHFACANEALMKVKGGMRGYIRFLDKAGLVHPANAKYSLGFVQSVIKTQNGTATIPLNYRVLKFTAKGIKVLKIGGGIAAIGVSLAADSYELYYSKDRFRTAVKMAGGGGPPRRGRLGPSRRKSPPRCSPVAR